jgi:hypothetical protein
MKKTLDKIKFSVIILLFQAEAARFSPMRIPFCSGSGNIFACVLAGGFIRQFFIGLTDWEVHRP